MKSSADIVSDPQQPQGPTNTFLGTVKLAKIQEAIISAVGDGNGRTRGR